MKNQIFNNPYYCVGHYFLMCLILCRPLYCSFANIFINNCFLNFDDWRSLHLFPNVLQLSVDNLNFCMCFSGMLSPLLNVKHQGTKLASQSLKEFYHYLSSNLKSFINVNTTFESLNNIPFLLFLLLQSPCLRNFFSLF